MGKTKKDTCVHPPTPIENLRTGELTHFGIRRAFDGAYIAELLAAKGCHQSDYEGLRFIAEALGPEFAHMKIGDLRDMSVIFHESFTEEDRAAMHKAGPGARLLKRNGVRTILPPDTKRLEFESLRQRAANLGMELVHTPDLSGNEYMLSNENFASTFSTLAEVAERLRPRSGDTD
jgi:hypothetical protein